MANMEGIHTPQQATDVGQQLLDLGIIVHVRYVLHSDLLFARIVADGFIVCTCRCFLFACVEKGLMCMSASAVACKHAHGPT